METVKLESRYYDESNIEWVHRCEYRGETLTERYFYRFAGGSWNGGKVFVENDHRWSLRIDRQKMWETRRFTPIKGIRETRRKTK